MSKNLINILIMDDRDEKIEAIKKLLIGECGLDEECISVAKNLNSGRHLLRQNYYDLLILDLVMPNIDGEDADHEAAPSFIEELYDDREYHLPNQIVGFTAYEEEYDNLKHRFDDKLWALIKYNSHSLDWKPKIRTKVNHLKSTKEMLKKSLTNAHKCDIGILCALDEEFEEMKEVFGNNWTMGNLEEFPLPFYTTEITTAIGNTLKIVGVCIGQAGLIPASAIASNMIRVFHPDNVFMTGISAGFKDRGIKFGDIIISKLISEPIIGKILEENEIMELKKEFRSVSANPRLLSAAQSLCTNDFIASFSQDLRKKRVWNEKENINIVSAPTVSVPFVVGSSKLMSKFQKEGDRKLSALDMEGFGFYYAADFMKTPCLMIKAITDLGDEHKDDAFHRICSYTSAFFLYKLIKEML